MFAKFVRPSTRAAFALTLASPFVLSACNSNEIAAPPLGPPAVIEAVASTQLEPLGVGTTTAPVQVIVRDQFGRPLRNATVTWRAVGGSVPAATTVTNAEGLASTPWQLGTRSGEQSLIANAGDAQALTFRVLAQPAAAQSFTVLSGGTQQVARGAASEPLAVRVVDQFGNGVPLVPVTFTATSGTLSDAQVVSDANGMAFALLVAGNAAATSTVTAALPSGATRTFTITVP
jgi:hypothetical protein